MRHPPSQHGRGPEFCSTHFEPPSFLPYLLLCVFQLNQLTIYSSIIPVDKAYQLQVCSFETFFFIFLLQVPSDKTDAILSLPLLELAGRLQEGSLSPRTVLYTYIQKVSAYSHPEGQIAYVIHAVMCGMVTC